MATNGRAASPNGKHAMAGEHFDVIVVGARCAGSSLATMLARAGLKVAVVEQATFPQTTLSSHLMEADALLFLQRLGVLDAVRATGVRFLKQIDMRLNDYRVNTRFPLRFDDLGGAAFLQRHLLDAILCDAAIEAGADVRMSTKVVEVLWERQRVCGVRVQHEGTESRLYAPLVVGADGRRSTIAYMCDARKYNVRASERPYYFTFFEGADEAYSDHFVFHRWGDRMVWAGPANNGLYLVGVSPEAHEGDYFRRNSEQGVLSYVRECEPTAGALAEARVATKIFGINKFDAYLRQAAGPGWVLAGDAGHFKDPSAGRGIGDAFMQTETLAPAIISGLDGSHEGLDRSMVRWTEWRDKRFEGHYWLATMLGKAGTFPTMVPEAVRRLEERGELSRFLDLFSHRSRYDDVFPLSQVGAATGRLLLSGEQKRLPLIREAVTLLSLEPRRRWTRRRPEMASTDLTVAPTDRLRGTDGASERRSVEPVQEVAVQNGALPHAAVQNGLPTDLVADGSR